MSSHSIKSLILGLFIISFSLLIGLKEASASNKEFQAAVAMPDRFSAEVAENILKQGGNAVDAAIAVGFSLAVTLPEAGNIGGGGFMLIRYQGKNSFVDYREVAPMAASRDMYLDNKGEVIPNLSLVGGKASGVPGTVAGMWEAHQKYSNLQWSDLLEPAIILARDGFIVPEHLAKEKARMSEWFKGKEEVNFERYFSQLQAGKLFKQPELADTLQRIAEKGPKGFYKGKTAQLISQQMKKVGGLISLDDLANYKAVWREPITAKWDEYQVISAPPPSSGGIALLQLLKMKAMRAPLFEDLGHNSASYIHLIAELEKRVYADRAQYLGDPDHWKVPVDALLGEDYLKERAFSIQSEVISETSKVKPGLKESAQTTHFSIVDQWGNAVSNTYTLNLSFGSGVVVEGAGFLLNNEMDDFSAKPGSPNAFGVLGGKANEIAPGKRMLSSMSPTILLKNNDVYAVVGTPGGSTIITSVFQTIINLVDFNMEPQSAVDSTRFHHQLFPKDVIYVNPEIESKVQRQLEDRGYEIKPRYLGDVQLVTKERQTLKAASDPRGRGESKVIRWKSP